MKHIVFEEICGGLTEHALPVMRACCEVGLPAIVGTFPAEIQRVGSVLAAGGVTVDLRSFDDAPPSDVVGALYSSVPNCPGPWLCSAAYAAAVPRIAATHGLTDKKTKYPADDSTDPLGYFNTVFATGPSMFQGSWNRYCKRYPETMAAMTVVEVGAPKTDVLCVGGSGRDGLLRRLGLDPALKTVLYSPTYQREASLEQFGCEIIEVLCALAINVIVRLHHCSTDLQNEHAARFGHRGKDWRSTLAAMQRNHGNLRHVEGDSNPYFLAADLLVGDVSGACYEFLLTNKPIVFMDVPAFFDSHGRDGIGCWGRRCGVIAATPSELPLLVQAQLDHPDQRRQARDTLIRKLVYNPGRAAETAASTIRELVRGSIAVDPSAVDEHLNRMSSRFDLPKSVLERLQDRRLAVYGAGQHSHMLFNALADTDLLNSLEIVAFVDDFPGSGKNRFRGIPVVTVGELDPDVVDCIVLSTDRFQADMAINCRRVLGPDVPVVDLYAGVDAL